MSEEIHRKERRLVYTIAGLALVAGAVFLGIAYSMDKNREAEDSRALARYSSQSGLENNVEGER
jgi:hypothetical protein